MDLSMYQASVPVRARSLANLDHILELGQAFAEQRRLEPAVRIGWRLAPDMFPLSRQVQIATDMAKGCMSSLAGHAPPSYADDETTFDQLRARVARTLTHVCSFEPAAMDGSETREVRLRTGGEEMSFNGVDYLFDFVLPNVHYHVTTTYALLRHVGVPLGKKDFLGPR